MKSKTMNIVTWVVQGLLSMAVLMAGIMKLMKPYGELASEMPWVEDFSPMQITTIGILELMGAIGLNLPFLIKKFTKIVPIAGAGIALLFSGAIITHISRGENFIPPLILLFMALFVTYSRKDLFK